MQDLKKCLLYGFIQGVLILFAFGSIHAQKITWEQLFRLSKASHETRKNLTLELGFDDVSPLQITVHGKNCECLNGQRKMQNNLQGVWYENIIFCPCSKDLVYGTENSTYYSELKTLLLDRFSYVEVLGNEDNSSGPLKLNFKKGNSRIECMSQPKETGITQHIIKLTGEDMESEPEKETVEMSKARYIALIIAVEKYDKPGFNLKYPKQNSDSLYQLLINKYNFSKDECILLNESPTRSEVFRNLDMLVKLKKNDNLLIFFAGHGLYDQQSGQGYWLTSDYSGNLSNAISNLDLQGYLKKIRSHHILVISDACYSGSIFNFKPDETGSRTPTISEIYSRKSRQALTSGELETVPDKSFFFESLHKVLTNNLNPYLTLSNLVLNIEKNIQDMNSQSILNKQIYGRLSDSEDYGGEFIFIKN